MGLKFFQSTWWLEKLLQGCKWETNTDASVFGSHLQLCKSRRIPNWVLATQMNEQNSHLHWTFSNSPKTNIGIFEHLNIGTFENLNSFTLEHLNIGTFEHLNIQHSISINQHLETSIASKNYHSSSYSWFQFFSGARRICLGVWSRSSGLFSSQW